MTARQIVRIRAIEQRLTRAAIGAGGLLLVVTVIPIAARWMIG